MKFGVSIAVHNNDQIEETLPLAVMKITKDLIKNAKDDVGTYIDYPSLNISVDTLIRPAADMITVVGTLENKPRPYTEEEMAEVMKDIEAKWSSLGWEMER